ncbi:MAG: uracil phosphoribosyltransferase [Anaerolineae bacterium]
MHSARVHPSQHPLVKQKLTILRDKDSTPAVFRRTIAEITTLLAFEATADLALTEVSVATPLATTVGAKLAERIGLVPVLRAGLGMEDAIWQLLPEAQVWHLGVFRDHETLLPVPYYNKLPARPRLDLCIVLDPMLATGGSAIAAIDMLKQCGMPRIKYLGIIAAPEGVRALTTAHPDVDIYVGAIDDHLTPPPSAPGDPPEGYIVPGLGDAGDRQFGTA